MSANTLGDARMLAAGSVTPRISICIANYQGEALLPECIDSILAQDIDDLVEIIVHDDASSDGSLELLQRRYPEVHVISSGQNVGFCVSNNRMVDMAHGEFVLLLNNDAALLPGALRALLDTAQARDGDTILTLPQFDWESGTLVDRGCLLDLLYTPVPNLDPQRQEVAYVIGACLFLPRALWQRLGGFPEWMESIAEDMYLCRAAKLIDVPTHVLTRGGYRHRQGASFGGNRVTGGRLHTRFHRRFLSERNRIAVLFICTPTWLAWPWLLLHVVVLLVEGATLSAVTLSMLPWRKIYWPALRDAWRQRGALFTKRRELQSMRSTNLRNYLRAFVLWPHKLRMAWQHGLPRIS